MVVLLTSEIGFPDPRNGEEDGFFAVGGDLSVDRLLLAYSNGIFPWYPYKKEDAFYRDEDGNPLIEWWCPMKRFVIFPNEIHISHTMRQMIKRNTHTVTVNKAFDQVIEHCGDLRSEQRGAWLGSDMKEAYKRLHDIGFALSVEVWNNSTGELAGGLYGVAIGKCIFGESMFSLEPSASKLALIHLAQLMQKAGGLLIDCQFETPHLRTMGGRHIPYDEYMKYVREE